jgi:5'(3')-deoxyribonucleotidase
MNNMKSKKIRIYVDMDNVLCDYQTAYDEALKRQPQVVYPQSQYGFFRNLEPIDGAKSIFKLLMKYFDVWILTAPSIQNPMCYTEKREWVETHLGYEAAERLILSPHKGLLIGDYLIDDIVEGRAKQNTFQGTQIVFGNDEFPDWLSVLEYFKQYYKL